MKQKTSIGMGMIIEGITGIVFGTIAGGTLLGTLGAISEASYPSLEEAVVHPFGFLLTVGILLGFWTGIIGGIIGALIGISACKKFLFGAASGEQQVEYF